MKKCSKCEEVKSFEEFYRDKSRKNGFRFQCKSCVKAYGEANKDRIKARSKAYHEANKDKVNTKKKAYYEANKDRKKAYREANKEKIKDKKKAYYEANKNKIKAKNKTYYEANKDKIKAYYEANKDKIKDRRKDYHEANKDNIKAREKAYKSAKRNERIEQLKQIIEQNTDGKWIYIMECGIYHKIGISNDPLRRVEEIENRTQAPTKIIYLAKANYGRTIDTEQIIHHELKCFNIPMPYAGSDTTSREWFYGSIDKMVEIVGQYAKLEDMQEVAV